MLAVVLWAAGGCTPHPLDYELPPAERSAIRVSLETRLSPGWFVRHEHFAFKVSRVKTHLDGRDSTLKVVAGLGDAQRISFESTNYPGHFLRHGGAGTMVRLERLQHDPRFARAATFRPVAGLAGQGLTTFEAQDPPGHYLAQTSGTLQLHKPGNDQAIKDGATFRVRAPNSDVERSSDLTRGKRISLELDHLQGRYVRRRGQQIAVTGLAAQPRAVAVQDRKDATFKVVAGLADPSLVSLEAADLPGHYLRHEYFQLVLSRLTAGDLQLRQDATFRVVSGQSNREGVSLEASNYSDRYLRRRGDRLYLEHEQPDPEFKREATFRIVEGRHLPGGGAIWIKGSASAAASSAVVPGAAGERCRSAPTRCATRPGFLVPGTKRLVGGELKCILDPRGHCHGCGGRCGGCPGQACSPASPCSPGLSCVSGASGARCVVAAGCTRLHDLCWTPGEIGRSELGCLEHYL